MEETIRLSVEPALRGEKGDPFTYEDFTPEQLEGLKPKKGIDYWTAEEVEEYITKPQQAEAARKTAEEARVSAETSRVSAESSRVSAENARVAAETTRNQAEQQRIAAENARTATFAEWEQKESEMEQAEAERIAAEQLRIQAENHREEFIGSFEDKLENTANGVVLSASGTHIAIEGASGNNRLQSLTVYGQTTQDGTPTPDAPVEMVSVENPMVVVCRKNLFNADDILSQIQGATKIDGNWVFESNEWYQFVKNGFDIGLYFEPDTQYTVSIKGYNSKESCYPIIIFVYTDGTTSSNGFCKHTTSQTEIFTSDAGKTIAYLKGIYVNPATCTVEEFQIDKGSISTEYEPFEGKTATLSDIVLRSTPDGKADRVLKDADGLWKVERNANEIDLGTLDWVYKTSDEGVSYFFNNDLTDKKLGMNLLCSKYEITKKPPQTVTDKTLYGNGYYIGAYNIIIQDSDYTDAESFKAAMSGVMLIYELAIPTYEVLPETIQTELNALHTYYPYTTIMNNAGTQMDAEYVADTKTYVNSNPYVATESMIDSRENTRASIPLENLDYAVKAAMCDGKGSEWTDDEKVSARNRLGANYDAEIQRTKRSLDALWKLNNGISYQYETDAETAYQKTVPSGAKLCGLSKIGGRTLVWNQIIDYTTLKNGTFDGNKFTSDKPIGHYSYMYLTFNQIAGHKYYFKVCNAYYIPTEGTESSSNKLPNIITYSDIEFLFSDVKLSETPRDYGIFSNIATVDGTNRLELRHNAYGFDRQTTIYAENIIGFDLTQMFGAGNEPSTVEEFEAMFPEDYYPYNAGELMSFPMNEMVEQGRNILNLYDVDWMTLIQEQRKESIYDSNEITIYPSLTSEIPAFSQSTGKLNIDAVLLRGKQITISCKDCEYPSDANPVIFLYEHDETNKQIVENVMYIKSNKSIPITVNENTVKFIMVFRADQNKNMRGGQVVFSGLQIEVNDSATEYSQYRHNLITTPQAILDLDGYGIGINDTVYNYVDKENKLYRKRIGSVDLGTLEYAIKNHDIFGNYFYADVTAYGIKYLGRVSSTKHNILCAIYETKPKNSNDFIDKSICVDGVDTMKSISQIQIKDSAYTDAAAFKEAMSGVMLIYELAEEEIIDISDILTDDEPFEVEAGGSLAFRNSNGDSYRVPIPTEEKYIVSLAEVSGVTV